jgi:hypothetical protein
MRILNEGDKSKAFCPKCEAIRAITYIYRDFTLDNGRRVPNVLQGVCQTCESAVSIPAQSAPKIQEAIQQKSLPFEIRVPPVLEDVLYTIGNASHLEKTFTLKCLIQYYSNKIAHEHDMKIGNFIIEIKNNHPLWFGTKRSRLSMKISVAIADKIEIITEKLALNKSDLITGILVKAKEDLIEKKNGREAKKFFESIRLFQDAV